MEKSAINPHTKSASSQFHASGDNLGVGVKLRTIFMGTPRFAAEILGALLDSEYNIISVYTQPDKKSGREQELKKSAVKIFTENKKIKIFQPGKFDSSAVEEIKDQKPDLIILAAYGKIVPKAILEIPGFGALNVHASLLPKYRGPSPIQNAILNGEKETGVTVMLMDEGIDTGDILSQKKVEIEKNETTNDLSEKLAKISSELLLKTVPRWAERKISPQKQDHTEATLCQLIEKDDGRIVWAEDAEAIFNRFRAFVSWPGIFAYWETTDGPRRIKLKKIGFIKSNPVTKHRVGEVFQLGEKIGVQTNLGVVTLEEVQLEGKTSLPIDEFINGYQGFIGSILK